MSAQRAEAVVIGVSAGAVQALSRILPALPDGYPIPVLVVVHVPADRTDLMAPLFQAKCRLAVKEAEDKEPIRAGSVYFGPSDYHMLVEADRTLSLSADEPVHFSRPSIDVLFQSAAEAYGAGLVGVILTGANEDGADGLAAIAAVQGVTLVEDPSAAFATAMPSAALERCAGAQVMSLDAIADYLVGLGAL